MPAYSVTGRLLYANGQPRADALIVVYEYVDIQNPEVFRGDAMTGSDGSYGPINWNQAQVADLFVVAKEPGPPVVEITRSSLICPAVVTPMVVDLVVDGETYRGRSEYERVAQTLAPLISPLLPHQVNATAIEWLACKADIYPPHIAMYVQAHRLVGDPIKVAADVYYALLRQGLGPDKRSILSTTRSALRSALERAYDQRILQALSGTVEDAIALAMADLDEVIADAAMVEPEGGETNLRALLETTGLGASLLRDFVELRIPFTDSNAELWSAVHAHPNLTGAPAETLQFTMEAAVLVRSFLPALEGLQALRTATTISRVADLAAWDVPQWLTFIGSNGGAPDDLPGANAGEREQLYAATMTRIVEERYPTQVLARRIERDSPASTTGVDAFLDDNPGFDVVHSVIPIYLHDNPSPPVDPGVVANLKAVQRVWSLTPRFNRYDVARVLLDGGITSAAQVVHGGAKAFAAAFASELEGVHPNFSGEQLAAKIYKSAVVKHTSAQVVLAQYAPAFNQVQTVVLTSPALPSSGSGVPTLAALMGNLDFCACEHCRSMLSPAAYLVDLLSRLEQTNALALLETRRVDLRHIELSCTNTNTVLPYIDIVNELLEYVATHDGDPTGMSAHQTGWTAAELRQFPEHRNVSAYNACASEVYPWSLPMHLSSVELGLYLQRLGVGRHEMMRAVQQPDGTQPATNAIVAEALGMTVFERDVVTGAQPADVAEAWHRSGAGFSTGLRTDLRSLLDTVELELDALLRLLALRFVVPLGDQPTQWLVYPGGEPSCDLDEIDLDDAFDDGVASRLHRFVRLSRKTGLSWGELDTALRLRGEQRSQANGVLDQQFLGELVDLLWLRSRLGLELSTVVAISSRIETHDYEGAPSLYSRLFVSKANPDGAFDLDGDQLDTVVPLAAAHHDTIRAGIRVNAADLELLIAGVLTTTANLNIATLSTLYAHAALARALRVRVDELLRLLALIDADPFESPAAGVRFVEAMDEIAGSRMSIAQLDYLCRHHVDEASGLHPSAEDIAAVLQTITDGVAALDAELDSVPTQHPELREQLLAHLEAAFADRQAVIDWMRILDQTPPLPDEDDNTLEGHVAAIGMDSAFVDVVLGVGFPNYAIAIAAFVAFRREQGQNALVDAALSEATGLSPEAAGVFARNDALIQVDGQSVQAQLVNPAALDADKIAAYLRVHKAAIVVSGLRIAAGDLTWYFDFENDTDTPQALDLNTLPLSFDEENDGTVHFERWRRVAIGQALQDSFTSAENLLPQIGVADQPRQDVADLFVENTTWEREDVEYLLGSNFLDLPDPVDPPLRDPRLVARIRDVIDLVRRTGVRASVMASWARQSVPTPAMAAAARRALESRHAESEWPGVVTPLTDTLRERQRDALVALIVQTNEWFDDDIALFSALLVDPKMNACMDTSRVRLALSSVQLFIQRLLLGLEDAEIPDRLSEDWSWMRIYRVWEANRSVFFWPENWAEPELRDDKTPFFRELEEQLAQGPLEDRQVERAFADYLYKLHEVSHLDIVALYHEVLEENEGQRAHVLGRTRSLPRKHFYRVRVNNLEWTAWEQPPLEIESDQVVLVAHNRRLFMIWLQLREESEERKNDDDEGKPPSFYRFQLSWSERREGEDWSPARTTPISRASTRHRTLETTDLYLRTRIDDDGQLAIRVLWYEQSGAMHDVLGLYYYDDCRDTMDEDRSPGGAYFPAQVGLAGQREVFAQQQRSFPQVAHTQFVLLDLLDGYRQHPLLLEPGAHRVVLSYPPHGTHVGHENPSTFDNGEHAFFITRWNVERGRPFDSSGSTGFPEPIVPGPTEPTTVAALQLPAADTVHRGVLWGGQIPGESMMTAASYAPLSSGDAPAVLAVAQQTAAADDALGLVGGGNQVPLESDEDLVRGYFFETFYHPYTCLMRSELNRHGVDGLLASTHPLLQRQNVVENHDHLSFTWLVAEPRPLDDFSFAPTAAYGVYNWELFYHVPLYIAERLRREQRFEQAMRWYHFIFDPLAKTALPGDTGTERYWNVKPLYREAKGELPDVDIVKYVFDQGYSSLSELSPPVIGFLASVFAWIGDPFSPHAIARWRPGTYRWVVLQRYLDNLIDWADSLFRRDTIETINEATQLYLLAAQILGPRPRPLPAISPPVSTYDDLDAPGIFGGFAELEDFMPSGGDIEHEAVGPAPPGPLWWYFCVPPNSKLLAYWDRVADRLYKIRNCQNIDGVKRALALFDPPIDPALLVKAKAAGLDLGAVIADLQAPLPHHRYRVLAARALELVGDVRALGSALQQALERKDAEHLQELRATHEVALLKAIRKVREKQVEEAEESRKVLDEQMEAAVVRELFYRTREKHSAKEKSSAQMFKAGMGVMIGAQIAKMIGGIISITVPTFRAGTGFFLDTGGGQIGNGIAILGDGLAMIGGALRDQSQMLQVEASYERRWDDWKFQEGQAFLEQNQITQQQVAADVRTAIAKKELENHDLQIEQSRGVEAFLRSRYTNEDLYNWLIGQISTQYFQSYKLAYDLAKKAERAMRYELGNDETFVEFGHWDSLHKGLLAGERLQLDLRRMEIAYLDKRRREYELSKRISLRLLDPSALLDLQQNARCEFAVPEVVFDLDHPGHYMRRIKSVSLTIPAVTGPHVTLGAKLTLLEDIVRLNNTVGASYRLAENTEIHEDPRFRLGYGGVSSIAIAEAESGILGYGGVSSIATSTAQADSGLFTLDFNDERLLPFEGSGAISRWRLQLPDAVRQFDYDTISDVELQIQYTARDGGDDFRGDVEEDLEDAIEEVLLRPNGFDLLLSAKEAFPEAWERFLYPVESPVDPLEIPIVLDQLSYVMRGLEANVHSVRLVFVPRDETTPISGATATLTAPGEEPQAMSFDMVEGRWSDAVDFGAPVTITDQPWLLELGNLTISAPDDVDNLFVVVRLVFNTLPEP